MKDSKTIQAIPRALQNILEKGVDSEIQSEKIHPLELKYGKEPKIEPQETWSWH